MPLVFDHATELHVLQHDEPLPAVKQPVPAPTKAACKVRDSCLPLYILPQFWSDTFSIDHCTTLNQWQHVQSKLYVSLVLNPRLSVPAKACSAEIICQLRLICDLMLLHGKRVPPTVWAIPYCCKQQSRDQHQMCSYNLKCTLAYSCFADAC